MPARLFARTLATVALVAALAPATRAQEIATLKPDGVLSQTDCIAFSPDGKALVMGSFFKTASVWDIEKKRQRYQLAPNNSAVAAVAFSPDGKYVMLGNWDSKIKIWDTTTKEAEKDLTGHKGWVTALAFLPDGKTLVSGSQDSTIKLWDFAGRKELKTIAAKDAGLRGSCLSVAVSADGKRVARAEFFGNVDVFDVETGKLVLTFSPGDAAAVAFSPDGKVLASSNSKTGVIQITDLTSKETVSELKGHSAGVLSLAFTPKGTLISGSKDQSVKLWDVKEQKEISTLKGHTKAVTSLALTKDGAVLATASEDGTVKLWDVVKAMK